VSVLLVFWRFFLLTVAFSTFTRLPSFGADPYSVKFIWGLNPESELAGYKLYIGNQSRAYSQALDVGLVTTFQLNGLQPGYTYFFALTAYDHTGLESDFSRELTYQAPADPGNFPPTLNEPQNIGLWEDSGPRVISLSGITPGSSTEVQPLSVSAVSDNTALIPHPSVSYSSPATTGSLVLQPVANAFGTAYITVTVNDGQAQNNRTSHSFVVTVSAVNDAPFFNALPNLSIEEGTLERFIPVTGIHSGAANERDVLSFTAVSSRPDLVPAPQVSYFNPGSTATLSLRATAGATGSAVITLTLNDGRTNNNTFTRSFSVNIAPAGSPPFISSIPDQFIAKNHLSDPIEFTVSDSETPATNLTVNATSSDPAVLPEAGLILNGSGNSRTLTLDPVNGQLGTSTVTTSVDDGSATSSVSFEVIIENR
jgi:hypothetical protein